MRFVLPSEDFFKYVDEGGCVVEVAMKKMPVFLMAETSIQPNF